MDHRVLPSTTNLPGRTLATAVHLNAQKVWRAGDAQPALARGGVDVVLLLLAAGKGTRFGTAPKCVQPVRGKPLARHTVEAFIAATGGAVIALVGYQHDVVAEALGAEVGCVRSENSTGGTAWAAYEAFAMPGLLARDPLVVLAMGDRIVPAGTFRRLLAMHRSGDRDAALTLLTAEYQPPRHRGKGRIVREAGGRVRRIIEQHDIDALADPGERERFEALTEGNCPLYALRASTLHARLGGLTQENAQGQFYLTDIIEALSAEGAEVRTITTRPGDADYDLLCADVTRPADLGRLDEAMEAFELATVVDEAVMKLRSDRPGVQARAIGRQLQLLLDTTAGPGQELDAGAPLAMGVSGGRLRVAFMHPDMARFYGPAWQMAIGAGRADGEEQIVVLAQETADGRLRLTPREPAWREASEVVPFELVTAAAVTAAAGGDPRAEVYEVFGTRLSEAVLRELGYVDEAELSRLRSEGRSLPSSARWVANNLRRPFPLVANAVASLRATHGPTREPGQAGEKPGLRVISTGAIPSGGFSSSSALVVATLNACGALDERGLAAPELIRLACRAEYGTGVRAGALDQTTAQTGRGGAGVLVSSHPREAYRVLATHPVPTDRIEILFPYTVPRDTDAWAWSWGLYAERPEPGRLTTSEWRKLTGKAAEIAAVLTQMPLAEDLFPRIQPDLLAHGELSATGRAGMAAWLRQVPVRITRAELRQRLDERRGWLIGELDAPSERSAETAAAEADGLIAGLLSGWRDPVLPGTAAAGVPLRAIVAYLFAEVVRNFRLIHHPEQWIECVRWSQRGDRCVVIDPNRLPPRDELEAGQPWERGVSGPARLSAWLEVLGATWVDPDAGLDDASLARMGGPDFFRLEGGNFFRGLALIDLAEAMLQRAFGEEAVAVRVNAAGQGDFFQVHIDRQRADADEVRGFIRRAIYDRFGLRPVPEFVTVHPGGPALGLRLPNLAALRRFADRLAREG